jgi:hypothetical protein
LGDLYLPDLICHACTGEPQGIDYRMVELLKTRLEPRIMS